MIELTRDKELFRRFWRDEKENTPQFFNDASETWTCSEEDFLGFCDNAERVYLIDGVALLYVERLGTHANIHFSLLRGKTVNVNELLKIRDELFKDYDLIFGWCGKHLRGLKRILEQCGLRFHGTTMLYGQSHGKVLEWQLFSIVKSQVSC